MKQTRLKALLGALFIGSRLLLVFLLFVMFGVGGFTFDQFTTAFAILLPMFAISASAALRDTVRNRAVVQNTNSAMISRQFAVTSLLLVPAYFICIATLIFLKASNVAITDFEQFKYFLAAGEAVFAGYTGRIAEALFGNGE